MPEPPYHLPNPPDDTGSQVRVGTKAVERLTNIRETFVQMMRGTHQPMVILTQVTRFKRLVLLATLCDA
jgi:hypothetical protein